jgi:hypothetical protein
MLTRRKRRKEQETRTASSSPSWRPWRPVLSIEIETADWPLPLLKGLSQEVEDVEWSKVELWVRWCEQCGDARGGDGDVAAGSRTHEGGKGRDE